MAVTGTALMVGITLPGTAGADDADGTGGQARGAAAAGVGEGGEAGNGSAAESRPPAVAVPREGERGTGRDPLTPAELSRAERIALTPGARSRGENAAGGRGPQHLATNLAEPPPSGPDAAVRRAEVSFYDYRADALVTSTVNLDTGKVERTGTQRGVQPSPHPDELREAIALILADPLGSDLKADYRHATGRSLTSPDQLWFNGDVYRTYREKNVPDELARCGEHRCVRLVAKVVDGPWIEIRDLIVDLSARTVARVG